MYNNSVKSFDFFLSIVFSKGNYSMYLMPFSNQSPS